jgi:carbamoyltransferase
VSAAAACAAVPRAAQNTSNTVIGIHDGHNASVAVVRNGRVEFALQEERITRVKNQGDAPRKALDEALGRNGAGDARMARIALNGRYMNYGQWQRERILDDYRRTFTFASRIRQPLKGTLLDRAYQRRKAASREERLRELGLSRERMEPVEHHLAHASAAYYTCPWPNERVLVLTCDGSGDACRPLSASAIAAI